ncbi:MAG: coproporphyrinogen dehydrogenase HemZ [Lachnospiraceae bacterium]|nr:coproporphyrinogen dehydrogenase HemZ [Lachnospiraceae bacterium]
MITIEYNDEAFEYDAYALTRSFFPGEETAQRIMGADAEADSVRIFSDMEKRFVRLVIKAGAVFDHDMGWELSAAASTEREFKWKWKLFFYDCLSEYTGRILPWGALTGVRPIKLIGGIMAEQGREGLEEYLYDEYRVSRKKAELGIRISANENALLKPYEYKGHSLYIGIPFCPSRCLYCSFLSYDYTKMRKHVAEYLDCVEQELKAYAEIMNGERPSTVYIGGGTPTALDAAELDRLLSMACEYADAADTDEFTVEAGRPDSLDEEKFAVMKKHGVSRISVNPQTFKGETLKLIGRRHSVADVERAFEAARTAGFDNINMDLILGLPGEDVEDVKHTLDRVAALVPDSLTVHSLALKRSSKMTQWIAEHGAITGMDHEAAMGYALQTAEGLGMEPYYLYRQKNIAGALENTGFAVPGKYGIYNVLIMEEVQSIYAIGAGTVSKKVYTDGSGKIERCDTHKDLSLYLSDIQAMIERKRRLFGEDK